MGSLSVAPNAFSILGLGVHLANGERLTQVTTTATEYSATALPVITFQPVYQNICFLFIKTFV